MRATNNLDANSVIARGSKSRVYSGIVGSKALAIKWFNFGDNSLVVDQQQGMHELQLSMDYRHPHLLPILGACVESSCLCLVFPLMSMGSLYDAMRNLNHRAQLSDGRLRLQLGIDVASALEYLHSVSVIHGNVSLTNILLRANDNRLEAVLCDMGSARAYHDDTAMESETSMMGTPGYMDPLCSSGQGFSNKYDIFALGVVLLQLYMGISVAYESSLDPPELYARMQPSLRAGIDVGESGVWRPAAADSLGGLILRCNSDSAADRPDSSRSVITVLEDILNSDPASTPAPVVLDPQRAHRECVICMGERGPVDCRFLPCKHSCVCYTDAQTLVNAGSPKCVLCRRPILQIEIGLFDDVFSV